MTESADNLVLEQLRALRNQVTEQHVETRDRLDRIEVRLSTIEQTLGGLYTVSASDREALHLLTKRVERIEKRLELND